MSDRTLYYGDNLDILREHFRDEVVDLIYLDPPFNSSRTYNVLFKNESGKEADAQIEAFDDTWHWGQKAEETYAELIEQGPAAVGTMISSMRQFIGTNQMMAYLVMMAARLVELHRVLKPTGSLYLHCDPTASHYLKVILDTVFGPDRFVNEVIWKRTTAHNDPKRWGRIHDTLLFYSKSKDYAWNAVCQPYEGDYFETKYSHVDEKGRYRLDNLSAPAHGGESGRFEWKGFVPPPGRMWRYKIETLEQLDRDERIYWTPKGRGGKPGFPQLKLYVDPNKPGVTIQDLINDIPPINSQAAERLGYPTQKPVALLERIIQASSNPGDLVLDPFSGCGTAIAAAQKLGRRWAGIDITHLAIAMHKLRLKDMYGLEEDKDYQVIGEPKDLDGARLLAQKDRYQFQWWALALIEARPLGSDSSKGKKGADRGVDGVIPFIEDTSGKMKRALVQVKSGHVKSGDVRDLRGVLDREPDAPIGVLLTLEKPTQEMACEAVSAGMYESKHWGRFARIQIVTIEDALAGARVKMPTRSMAFQRAERVRKSVGVQAELDLGDS